MKETDSRETAKADVRSSIKRFRMPLRIITVLIVAALLLLWGLIMISKPYDRTLTTYSNFVVEESDDTVSVSEKLEEEGYIKDAAAFRFVASLSGSSKFRPGTYYISPSMDSRSIARIMAKGLTTSTGFTIPAGYTVEQTAAALDRDGLVDKDAFLEAAASPDLAQLEIFKNCEPVKGAQQVEGFLLPGDYELSNDADESMILIMMLDSFSNFYTDDFRARADEMGISTREVLIIASMIEKETSIDKERAAISSVIHNRYNLDLMTEDEIPKIPLCSPGKESIIAALYPDETEYTHYVLSSRLDGSHVFTSDDAEYEALLEEYNAAYEAKQKEKEAAKEDKKEDPESRDAE